MPCYVGDGEHRDRPRVGPFLRMALDLCALSLFAVALLCGLLMAAAFFGG